MKNLNATIYPLQSSNALSALNGHLHQEPSASRLTNGQNPTEVVADYLALIKAGKIGFWVQVYLAFLTYCIESGRTKALAPGDMVHGVKVIDVIRGLYKDARSGHVSSQGWLGIEYNSGICLHCNTHAAEKWLRVAALNGCYASQFNLAVLLAKKIHCSDTAKEARELYRALRVARFNSSIARDGIKGKYLADLSNVINAPDVN